MPGFSFWPSRCCGSIAQAHADGLRVASLTVAPPALATVPAELPSVRASAALIALGIINTGLGFWLFYSLIDEAGAGKASLITYATPGVAALLGIAVLGGRTPRRPTARSPDGVAC